MAVVVSACGGLDVLPVSVRSGACGPMDVWMSVDHQVVMVAERAEPVATTETDRPLDGRAHVGLKVQVGVRTMSASFDVDLAPGGQLDVVVDCARGEPKVLHF